MFWKITEIPLNTPNTSKVTENVVNLPSGKCFETYGGILVKT